MRSVYLIASLLLCVGTALAQSSVTLSGRVISVDSAGANIVIRTGSREQLVVLPSRVDIRWQKAEGNRLALDALTPGTIVTIDAAKSPTGQVTARQVVVTSRDGTIPPGSPPAPNQVTLRPSPSARTGVRTDTSGGSAVVIRGAQPPEITAVRSTKLGHGVGEVRVNGRTVFRFRGVHGGDPYLRAQEVARRLNAASMANLRPEEVRIGRAGGEWAVMARNVVVITADRSTARINATSPRMLAAQWAATMREQLS